MKNLQPSELCGACSLYDEKCHCMCHKKDLASGFHEIITDIEYSKSTFMMKIFNKIMRNNRI